MSEYLRSHIKKEYFNYFWGDIKFKTHFGVCIFDTLKKRGYNKTQDNDWNIFWSEKQLIDSVFETCRIQPHQKVNHFRSYYQLCRKDNLSRNIKRYKKQLQKQGKNQEANEYNFHPLTFHLPLEYNIFLQQFKKNSNNQNKNIWIMKPVAKSQGKGIFLFNKISSISNWAENNQAENYIVQKYITDPLLIGGKKFDLRLYVLCLSYHPLTVYLNRSGFARFTHYRYDQTKIYQSEIHLTNVAIQKNTEQYNSQLGGKWFVDKLKLYLLSKFEAKKVNQCFYNIQTLIIKSLKAVTKLMANDKHCFQLYGFDVMLDSNLKPWIIQVNGSPSMRANTKSDYQLKCGLIDDVLTIIDLQKILTGSQQQVGGFDLIYKNDIPKNSILGPNISFLGCKNNREENMQKLAKSVYVRLAKEFEEKKKSESDLQQNQINNKKALSNNAKNVRTNYPGQMNKNQREVVSNKQKNTVKLISQDVKPKIPTKNWIIRKNSSFRKQNGSTTKLNQSDQQSRYEQQQTPRKINAN